MSKHSSHELIFPIKEDCTLYSPTLYNLYCEKEQKKPDSEFPRLKIKPLLRLIQDIDTMTIVIEDLYKSEEIDAHNDPHGLADEESYRLELFLNLNIHDIRHIHSFTGAILSSQNE